MLLARGTLLRRRSRTAARPLLRQAREEFDGLGLWSWQERARTELAAAGERSSARETSSWATLTAQERQIAWLATQGMSNREIGARLYLSHRTVGSHLYRLFPKLGISRRTQLRRPA
jgi:DNA-binding CsgD family transcriptional regulator